MGTVTVRVIPRSPRTSVEVGEGRPVVRVRSAPERGRATSEAGRALARALGVPVSGVSLRGGGRSRTKVFEVEGLTSAEIAMRLGAP
jgi:hypothetical protein